MLKLQCVNCGAPLEIGADMDTFACGYCGTNQTVERKGGTVALRRVESAIKAVQRGTDRTAAELAIPRLQREIAEAETARQLALTAAQAGFVAAKKSRFYNALWTFVGLFFVYPVLITSTLSDKTSPTLFAVASMVWLIALVVAPIVVYVKSKKAVDTSPAVKAEYQQRLQKLRAQLDANRKVLDELPV